MSGIRIHWDEPTESDWRGWLDRCRRPSLFQSWSFGAASAAHDGVTVHRGLVLRGDCPLGLVQVFVGRIAGAIRFARMIRGPAFFAPAAADEVVDALACIRRTWRLRRGAVCTLMPEVEDDGTLDAALRRRGFHRVMAGYETAWLDLARPLPDIRKGLDQKWRNRLVKAEAAGLDVARAASPGWLLARYAEHKRQRRYAGPSPAVLGALPASDLIILEARRDRERLAGALLIRHGSAATYQVGWNSAAGKRLGAQNLLLWRAVEAARDEGVTALDLGGLFRDKAPGVAHFKAGLGGRPVRLAGTYV